MESLIKHFQDNYPFLTEEDFTAILQIAQVQTVQKGEIFHPVGKLNVHLALVISGLMRSCYVKENGDEITTDFMMENHLVASYDSIILKRPTKQQIDALEDSQLLVLEHEAFIELCAKNPRLNKTNQDFTNGLLAYSLQRVESFLLDNPQTRYQNLIEQRPNLVQRVPQKYIASYLGITPVSLSRLRKRMLKG